MTAALHIHQLNKHFANGKHALRDINLTVQRGEMVALIGASGSGKSTLLRHVAGLVVADASSDSLIEVDGRGERRFSYWRDAAAARAYFDGDGPEAGGALHIYSRLGHPGLDILEARLAAIDGAEAALAYCSGMAAQTAVALAYLRPGEGVVFGRPFYSGVDGLFNEIMPQFGTFAEAYTDGCDEANMWAACKRAMARGPVALLAAESPGNPTAALVDLDLLVNMAGRIEAALPDLAARAGLPVEAARVADWAKPNGWSVLAGAERISGDYLLMMADHVFAAPLLQGLPPIAALAAVYFLGLVLTEFLSNNAVAVIYTPVAIELAHRLGYDPRPFVVAVMFSATLAFATPVGYQIHRVLFDKETGHPYGGYALVKCVPDGTTKVLGRPCDVVEAPDGTLLWSDTRNRKIYRISKE